MENNDKNIQLANMEGDLIEKLSDIATKYHIRFSAVWGIKAFNWIWYKVEDEKSFKVQIFTHGNIEEYNSIKSDIVNLFLSYNYSLSYEHNLDANSGFHKELYFMDTEQLQTQEKEKYLNKIQTHTHTYNFGNINAEGSIVTLGDVINSTQNIDNSILQIENLIKEKGGEDKDELNSILNDTKEIINTISEKKEIKPIEGFREKLSIHLSKNGWFYGEIISLLGTAVLSTL